MTAPLPKVPLWQIKGDGYFFHTFYVPAANLSTAAARASDALAGSDTAERPYNGYSSDFGYKRAGKRFYNTVEKHIVSITKTDLLVEDA
jgi:hypothetical protein